MGYFEQLAQIRREEAVQEGMKVGVREGLRKGVQEGLETAVRKLLANTEFSVEEIAKLTEVPVALVEKVKKEMKAK